MVTFDGEWNDEEIATAHGAAQAVGNALARAHNSVAMQAYRIGASSIYSSLAGWEAFLAVYGGQIVMNRVSTTCEVALGATCWGSWDEQNLRVNVYTNANGGVTGNYHFLVHELGHGFESRVNGILGGNYIRNMLGRDGGIFRRNVILDESPNNGFAGPLWDWQQSDQATPGEEFADMYIGWTYNRWETNARLGILTPQGQARSRFMSANMSIWTFLVVQE